MGVSLAQHLGPSIRLSLLPSARRDLRRADRRSLRRRHGLRVSVFRRAAARADGDICSRPLPGPHHFQLLLSLDSLSLPAGLRLPDRNVDGACLVLADPRVCYCARNSKRGIALVFATLLALVFTHGGALIFAVAIVATLSFRGLRDAAFLRAAGAFFVVLSIWAIVKARFPPDSYIADVLHSAALHVFDVIILAGHLVLLLVITLASYGIAFYVVRRLGPAKASICAASMVALGLGAYWVWFDGTLHTDNRYYLRTVLLIATPALGMLAAAYALRADGRMNFAIPLMRRRMAALATSAVTRSAAGAIALVTLVHIVETEKFVRAWRGYEVGVRTRATGALSDAALGDPHFVSSDRIGPDLNRLSWSSTTHFLSVLVTPRLAPLRLVIDPNASYFWLSCTTATANEEANRAVPAESRRLVRVHACLHR